MHEEDEGALAFFDPVEFDTIYACFVVRHAFMGNSHARKPG